MLIYCPACLARKELLRTFTIGVCLCLGMWTLSCGPSESEPVDIESGDACSFCQMPITQPAFASEIISDGKVYKFDDLACLNAFKTKRRGTLHGTTYVKDFASKHWMRFEAATIVTTDVPTPMGSGMLAFANAVSANAFAKAHPSKKAM